MNHIKIEEISKSFGETEVLQNITFDIKDGEFVVLLGPSGSGKSTLFQLIGGLLQPDSGRILLNDQDITGTKGNISYMPQSPSLLPWRTIMENVLLGQEIKGKKDTQVAKDMLDKAGLEEFKTSYPSQLSGGMKQRAAFIRALLSPQPFICLDEPFSALDELTRYEMQSWLLSIWEENKQSVLFVTHNIEEAIFLADRIIILSERPATVQKEFDIPFKRPKKKKKWILSDEFLFWKRKIYKELEGEEVI
ncbi:ABC transporter ATP-binding protein [Bacillus coahuilensis]|uniref:ABC transporter ATP-binding protein n=1 Tax=Bacillus coahuilensis TaxID=408580 RepID=UPI0001850AC0|nr:ABC transporter ATP-binding protein [Bacillus coahuilensis]